MSVGFGFSVGDFIAGIQLVREVISSLQSGAGSALEYRTLVDELFSLERALLEVKALKYDDCEATHIAALKCAATQCQSTIDRFLAEVTKYQPSLNALGSGSKIRDGIRKIQWALCKKPDLEVFKAEVRGHAGSINLLLATAQMKEARLHDQRSRERQEAVSSSLNRYFLDDMRALDSLRASATTCAKQGQRLLQSIASIVQSNLRIYQTVIHMHNCIQALSLQAERKQPVYFIDAFGKESPFFLEWVYSNDVLQDWLERRFEGTGRDKVIQKEFVIEDVKTNRQIDLSKPWHTLFYPGMHVGMDMVFTDMDCVYENICPTCRSETRRKANKTATCSHCGTKVRCITLLDEDAVDKTVESTDPLKNEFPSEASYEKIRRKRIRHKEICQFRRLRLLSKNQPQSSQRRKHSRRVELRVDEKLELAKVRKANSCCQCYAPHVNGAFGGICIGCQHRARPSNFENVGNSTMRF